MNTIGINQKENPRTFQLLFILFSPTILLTYYLTILLPTILLSYYPTILLSYNPTILLSYYPAILLSYYPTILLSYSYILKFFPSNLFFRLRGLLNCQVCSASTKFDICSGITKFSRQKFNFRHWVQLQVEQSLILVYIHINNLQNSCNF